MEKMESMIVVVYFGIFFLFIMMINLYMSLKDRLRRISREMEYYREDIKEMKRDIWKLK